MIKNTKLDKLEKAVEAWNRRPLDYDFFVKEKPMDPEALAEELSDKLIKIIGKQLKEKKAEKFGKKEKD